MLVTTSTDSGSSHHWLLQVVDGPQFPDSGALAALSSQHSEPAALGVALIRFRAVVGFMYNTSIPFFLRRKGHVPDSCIGTSLPPLSESTERLRSPQITRRLSLDEVGYQPHCRDTIIFSHLDDIAARWVKLEAAVRLDGQGQGLDSVRF